MTLTELANLTASILVSLGGAGAIVFGFSSALGRVWAERLMGNERAAHERALAELRNRLEHQTRESLAAWEADLSIFKDKHLRGFHDKLATYRLVIDLVSEILGDFDQWHATNQPLPLSRYDSLNKQRLRAYGYMGLLAPQPVMDALDGLFDHLLLIAKGQATYEWAEVRKRALVMLNAARQDVGVDASSISYNGTL